jgi:hypothetical protein
MKVNCLSCGHNIDLDGAYEEHYEGAIKCFGCDAILEIKTEEGSVRAVHLMLPPGILEREIERERLVKQPIGRPARTPHDGARVDGASTDTARAGHQAKGQ